MGIKKVFKLIRPPALADDSRYKAALHFKEIAKYESGKNYDWVCDYAQTVYGQLMATRDALDDKASDVIKYLGGGAGLFTIAALLNAKPENIGILYWALPSFLATIISVYFAVLARQPSEVVYPPSIKAAMEYVEYFADKEEALAAFLGQWHAACEGMNVVVDRKAELVGFSIQCFFAVIVLLLLPVLRATVG